MAATRALAADDFAFERKYQLGETYRYRVSAKSERNGAAAGEAQAVATHSVTRNAQGIPVEQIRWSVLRGSDEAEKVPPYEISLDPRGRIDLPPPSVPAMIGMVTDLNTFMVAISPAVGVGQLRKDGDRHTHPELLRGDFKDGGAILLGQDCTEVALTLLELTPDVARIESRFSPPARPCLEPREAWMAGSAQAPSNFQMIRRSAPAPTAQADAVSTSDVFWGTEAFTIVSKIRRIDGRLLEARMENDLSLSMRMGCDAGLAKCRGEFPVQTRRVVTLELLP